MFFLVLKKDGREGFAGIQLRLTLHQILTLTELFLSLTIRRKKVRNKTLIVCSVLVVSLKITMENTRYDVRNVSDGPTHFVLLWKKILFVRLVRDKQCFVLSLYPSYLYFFFSYFVNILCSFFVNCSPPHIRNTCAPNLGRGSFYGNEFYARFSFHNVWCLRSNGLFINQIKLFLCFEKFYIFLSF